MDRRDDELEELLGELSTTLSELQEELSEDGGPRPQRRLPSPGRFLRFTEEHTIPTLISLLETHIRALELLQGLLRLVNGREERSPPGGEQRVRNTGRRTLDALDGVLSDLQGAVEGQPPDDDARSLLNDARSLSEEIDAQLSGAKESRTENHQNTGAQNDAPQGTEDGAIRIDVEGPDTDVDDTAVDADDTSIDDADSVDEPEDGVSVDEELDTIKRELQDDEDNEE